MGDCIRVLANHNRRRCAIPNHVENDLVIHGDPETLRAFVAYAEGPAGTSIDGAETALLSAHRFIPMPKELAETASGSFGSIGYDAWYGNAGRILEYPWVKDAGVTSQEQLKEFLRAEDSLYEEMANRYKDNLERFGFPTWYEWAVQHWGTKWGLYEVQPTCADFEYRQISYTLLTAWSPPVPVIQAMSKQFPSLMFCLDYFEGGAGFMGSCVYENGQEVDAASAPYHGDRGG